MGKSENLKNLTLEELGIKFKKLKRTVIGCAFMMLLTFIALCLLPTVKVTPRLLSVPIVLSTFFLPLIVALSKIKTEMSIR